MNTIPLTWADLALASTLVLFDGLLSLLLRLGLERRLLVAAVRMVLQLGIMGYVLSALFAASSPLWTALAAFVMILFAGREVVARQDRCLAGWWAYGLSGTSILLTAATVTVLALTTPIQPDPWYAPRYALPLLGMMLGNTMTGISLGLNTLTITANRDRAAVEARLALGATRWQALTPVARESLRSGLMPVINAMSATGLVFLPGMMTGQLLAGADPQQAVRYQILVMFLIAGATGFGVLLAVLGAAWRLTDDRHRLRLDRLSAPRHR